jgi:hypothetical protein
MNQGALCRWIQVAAEIRINDLSMTRIDQLVDVLYCVQRAAVCSVGILFRRQVGLEDRFEYQHGRSLHNPIPDCRDGQRELHTNPVSLWDGLRSGILFIHFVGKASQYSRNGG